MFRSSECAPTWPGSRFPEHSLWTGAGRVAARFFEDSYIERNTVSSLLIKLGATGASVRGHEDRDEPFGHNHLPSDAAVAPGNRFSLVVEVAPHSGIHVYAPGAEKGYRVIALTIQSNPGCTCYPDYPASEIYFLQAAPRARPGISKAVSSDSRAGARRYAAAKRRCEERKA